MTYFGKSGVNGHRFLSVEISGSDFGFGRRAHHIAHDFGHSENWAIGGEVKAEVLRDQENAR